MMHLPLSSCFIEGRQSSHGQTMRQTVFYNEKARSYPRRPYYTESLGAGCG